MLGIVVVSYRSDERTIRFVQEELHKVLLPHRIVVVDNGATVQEAASLAARLGDTVTAVLPAENGGFAKGNNLGVRYLNALEKMDAFLFVNNDIRFESPDVVEHLFEKLHAHPEAGAAGPEIVGLDGRRQSPEAYLGLWDRYVLMDLSTPFLSRERKARRFLLDYAENAGEGAHYKLMGSCLMVSAEAFVRAGMFDENTFLYAEEPILSERMAAIGKCQYFCPSVRVVHEHGATISTHHSRWKMRKMQLTSMLYYYRTYRGYARWQTALAGAVYLILNGLK